MQELLFLDMIYKMNKIGQDRQDYSPILNIIHDVSGRVLWCNKIAIKKILSHHVNHVKK